MSGNPGVRVMSLLKAQNRETEKRGTYIMPRQLHSTHSKRAVECNARLPPSQLRSSSELNGNDLLVQKYL